MLGLRLGLSSPLSYFVVFSCLVLVHQFEVICCFFAVCQSFAMFRRTPACLVCLGLIQSIGKPQAIPHLEYASTIWNPALQRDIRLIEKVQKRTTNCIKGLSNKSYSERLSILKLDSLQKRRLVCDLVTVYKIIHHLSPLDASKVFQ